MKQFIKYWDEFHKEWYDDISTNGKPIKSDYKGWSIPSGKGGNKEEIWRYFPEPYWGDPTKELDGIFLNINPGGGSDTHQDILNQSKSDLYPEYINNGKEYSKTMVAMNKKTGYSTTEWLFSKRRKRLS